MTETERLRLLAEAVALLTRGYPAASHHSQAGATIADARLTDARRGLEPSHPLHQACMDLEELTQQGTANLPGLRSQWRQT